MLARRPLPLEVFNEADWFLWRGVELGEALGPQLTAETYEPWTFAPDFVTDDQLARLRSGVLEWEARSEGTWDRILEYIVGRMREHGATLVVPDSMARLSDSGFSMAKSDYFALGETPYYVARSPDRSAVETAWRDAGSAAGELAVLTVAEVPVGTEATMDDVIRCATGVIDVIVEAYDHSARAVFFTRTRTATDAPALDEKRQ